VSLARAASRPVAQSTAPKPRSLGLVAIIAAGAAAVVLLAVLFRRNLVAAVRYVARGGRTPPEDFFAPSRRPVAPPEVALARAEPVADVEPGAALEPEPEVEAEPVAEVSAEPEPVPLLAREPELPPEPGLQARDDPPPGLPPGSETKAEPEPEAPRLAPVTPINGEVTRLDGPRREPAAPRSRRGGHNGVAGSQPRTTRPAAARTAPICQVHWIERGSRFTAKTVDADGVEHRLASSPPIASPVASPPEQTPDAERALRQLAKELRERGWKPLRAKGTDFDEPQWYARRFKRPPPETHAEGAEGGAPPISAR
jgi:hypothetical protein